VRCLGCETRTPRARMQQVLRARNPAWAALEARAAPDGDADVEGRDFASFEVPACTLCGGMLKPDVVFFGESVPRERVERCYQLVERAKALLVLGSSLTVMSGYRFVVRATKLQIPVAIVNQGSTRADGCASIRVDAPLGVVLPALAAGYLGRRLGP